MLGPAMPEKRAPKRVRFSEKNDVVVFHETTHTDTNSGIRNAEPGGSLDVGFGKADTASDDDGDHMEPEQEHVKAAQKFANLSPFQNAEITSRDIFETSDDDDDDDHRDHECPALHSAPVASESPIENAWDWASRPKYRPSAAFAYSRGPSLPRGSMLSVIMNADDSGPLADMAEDSGGMDTESPGLIPDDTQQLSDGELHDCVLPGHDSNTASPGCGMDTSVSSVQYGDQQEIAASRPAAPLIWEDSWSTGNARDDTQERLQDITGIKNAAPSVTSRDTVDDPAIKSAKRRMASDVPRESLHRDRPALAPLPSQSRLPILTVEGRKNDENETDHLLNGDIKVDSAFLRVNKSVEAQTGPTARLLHFEAQGESAGDQILDLGAEQVDDAEYLLQAMGLPEEQMSASRTTARNYEMPPSLQASPPGNQVAAANIREERLGGQVFSTRSAPLLTPTKGGHDGHDARGHKSPGGKKAVKRHRAHPSSPLRQMSSRLRTTTPKSPFPTTGTPLHTIKEESGSPAPVPTHSQANTMSPDEHNPLRVLPFMRSPGDDKCTGLDEDEMYHQTLGGDLLQRTPPDDPQGTHSKLIAQAVAQANSGVVQQLLQHSSEVQLKLLEVLRKIGADATQNPPSAYHSFEYASSDEQTAILRDLSAHLDSAKYDADRMIIQQVLRCESVGCQKLLATNIPPANLLPAHNPAREAVCGTACQVEAVCDAVDELHITLKKFVRAEEDRYTASHTKVENFQSQLKDINARRQYSQATIEEMDADIQSKKAALERIQHENEKQMQTQQAAEVERLKFEEVRKTFVLLCDDTGCLLKKTRRHTWNGKVCTEVTWQLTDRVMCILRFTDASAKPSVFLRYQTAPGEEHCAFHTLLESCLELDPTDGRCQMAEEIVRGPPSKTLAWCKTVVYKLEGLSSEVSCLPMNVHMVVASSVDAGGKIRVSFLCLQRAIEVSLTFAVAIATSSGKDGMIEVHLQDFHHTADDPFMADVVDHTLRSYLKPANGNWFVQTVCLDLRAALIAVYSAENT